MVFLPESATLVTEAFILRLGSLAWVEQICPFCGHCADVGLFRWWDFMGPMGWEERGGHQRERKKERNLLLVDYSSHR